MADVPWVRLADGSRYREDADLIEDLFGVRPEGSPPMSRADHLAWAQERALEYVDDDPAMAFTSLISDLGKHPNLRDHPGLDLGRMLLAGWAYRDNRFKENLVKEMRNHIEGYR